MHPPVAGRLGLLGVPLRAVFDALGPEQWRSKPAGRRFVLLAGLLLASIGLQLLNPQVIRYFIDVTQAGGPGSALVLAAVAYLAIGLLGRGVTLAASYIGMNLGWQATNALRSSLAAHLLRLDMPFHKEHAPGELVERVDGDAALLGEFFSTLAVKLIGNALLVIAILVLLWSEDARAGLALTAYTTLTVAALILVGRFGVRAWAAARQAWADQFGFLEERIGGTEDIRGVGAEAHVLQELDRLLQRVKVKARRGWLANALGYAITNFLFITGYGLGLALGAYLYLAGDVTIGAAFLIVTYIGMLASPLDQLRRQAETLQAAAAGLARVSELLALRPRVGENPGARLPQTGPLAVAFEAVSFRYDDGDVQAGAERPAADAPPTELVVNDLSFELAAGRVLGVLGRTGSGKTTLTRLLFRLYDPTAGTIRLAGADIRQVAFSDLRARVGLVTQDVQLFGASVRDNIALFDPQVSDDQIAHALSALGLLEWVAAMPQGLATPLAAGGAGMSAGEAQLLAFARVMLRDPGLVILDEAASRLDPVTERRLEGAIDRLLAGRHGVARARTALVIAHRLRTLLRADDILILENGRVTEFGPRADLAADPGSRYSELLRAGMEEVLI